MKINKYLKELGLTQNDMPGYYDPELKGDCPAADERNKENEEGFCLYEFFSLDYSMALYIYPRLCEFKDKYASIATPAFFCYRNGKEVKDGNKKWLKTLDKIILAFQYIIKAPEDVDYKRVNKVIARGLALFAQHYTNLWY